MSFFCPSIQVRCRTALSCLLRPQICDGSSGSPCFHELLVVLRNIGQVFCRHVLQFGFIWCVGALRLRLWVRRLGGRIPQSWNVLLFTSRCRVHDGNMACPWSFVHNHLGRGWCLLGFSAGILLFPMPDSAVEVNDGPAPGRDLSSTSQVREAYTFYYYLEFPVRKICPFSPRLLINHLLTSWTHGYLLC